MRCMLATTTLLATAFAHNGLIVQNPQAGQIERIADEPVCNFQHYASMGDSYSVGLRSIRGKHLAVCNGNNGNNTGPEYCTTKPCAKNIGAYAWQFHTTYQPTYFDWFACSGANSSQWHQYQLPQLNSSTDLISITLGGDNGNAFARVIENCIYNGNDILRKLPWLKFHCANAFANANSQLETITSVINDALVAINQTAPQAKIMIMGYIQLWSTTPDETYCYGSALKSVSAANKTLINSLVSQYNTEVKKAVNTWNAANINIQGFINVTFVDVDQDFEGHRFCDEKPYLQWDLENVFWLDELNGDNDVAERPWSNIWPWSGVCHPNECGQQTYLNALVQNLGCTMPSRS